MRFWQLVGYQVVSAKFKFWYYSISSYYIPKSGEKKDTNVIDHQPQLIQLGGGFFAICGEKTSNLTVAYVSFRMDASLDRGVQHEDWIPRWVPPSCRFSYFWGADFFWGGKYRGSAVGAGWGFRDLAFNQIYVDDIL